MTDWRLPISDVHILDGDGRANGGYYGWLIRKSLWVQVQVWIPAD